MAISDDDKESKHRLPVKAVLERPMLSWTQRLDAVRQVKRSDHATPRIDCCGPWRSRIELQRKGQNIVLVRANSAMGPAFYYVQAHPGKLNALCRAVASGGVNLLHYGQILLSGYGHVPTRKARAEMFSKYGFETET